MSVPPNPAIIDQRVIDGLRGLFQDERQAQAFLNDLIAIFRDSAVETAAAMQVTLAGNDLPTLAKHAHRLKGIGRNIGASRLGEACSELEATATQAPSAAVRELCARINQEVVTCCSELTSFYYRAS